MNFQETYQQLSNIFENKEINYNLINELKESKNMEINKEIKKCLLEFLIDPDDKKLNIKSENDFWFINVNDKFFIQKYIDLMIDLIKTENSENINIFKKMEIFINSNIGNKLIYIFSIISRFDEPKYVYLQFLGFIIGENKDFIKKKYLQGVENLLKKVESNISDINNKMPISSLDENILEILNLYFFYKVFNEKDKDIISSIEKPLVNSNNDFNKIIYYNIIENNKLLLCVFVLNEEIMKSKIIKQKENNMILNIKNQIEEFNINNQNLLDNEKANNEESLEEESKEIEDDEEDENKIIIPLQLMSSSGESPQFMENSTLNKELKKEEESNTKEGLDINKINEENNINSNSVNTFKENIANIININNHQETPMTSGQINVEKNKNNIIINNVKTQETKNLIENNNNYNININDINTEKDINTETSMSTSSKLSLSDKKIFEQINNYNNYPLIEKLDIKENNNDDNLNLDYFVLEACSYWINLNKIIDIAYNTSRNFIQSITILIEKIKNNVKFKMFSINNNRLEIIINFLKNPNIINIKRKLIEIMIFHLYYSNPDYCNNNDDYSPTLNNLIALEKLITSKNVNNKNAPNVENDLNKIKIEKKIIIDKKKKIEINDNNTINNITNNPTINNINNTPIDKIKQRTLEIAKSFLDFYITKLHPPVHISQNNANLYLLPQKMFNTKVEGIEYLYDLESIINDKNTDKNVLIGLDKSIVPELEIYNEKKILTIDEAIKILFSFDSKLQDYENSSFQNLKKRQIEFESYLNKIEKICKNIRFNNISSKITTLDFSPEINKQINGYVNSFENEALSKLTNIIDILIEGNPEEYQEIIKKLQSFFETFFNSCQFELTKTFIQKFKNKNHTLYFIKIKTLILEKIIKFLEETNKKCIQTLTLKENSFQDLTKKVLSNIRRLKNILEKKNVFEDENVLFAEWIKVSNYNGNEITFDKIKEYFKAFISKDLNLEMNYTYDSKFCLWAIKNEFGKYFE